jgi:hypothetical protein
LRPSGREIGANRRQQVVRIHRRLRHELVGQLQASRRTKRHADRDGAVQFDHRRRSQGGQTVIQGDDAIQSVASGVRARA